MKCSTCNGCGKVDSKDSLPWNRYLTPDESEKVTVKQNGTDVTRTAHPHESAFLKSIYAGEVLPVNCPDCKGTGEVLDSPKPNEKSKR